MKFVCRNCGNSVEVRPETFGVIFSLLEVMRYILEKDVGKIENFGWMSKIINSFIQCCNRPKYIID